MKRSLLLLTAIILYSLNAFSQNLNVTLSDQLSYGSTDLANICSWTDSQDGKEYALVGAADNLSIVDVSDPTNIFEVTSISGPDCLWREVKVNGNYAYVTTEC